MQDPGNQEKLRRPGDYDHVLPGQSLLTVLHHLDHRTLWELSAGLPPLRVQSLFDKQGRDKVGH